MKKIVFMVMAAMFLAAPVQAQENSESFEEAVTGLWTKAKKAVKKSSRRVQEEWNGDGLVDIEGHSYMHLYTTDLYKGPNKADFKEACLNEFKAKYPTVKVLSTTIPQEEWTESTTRSLGKVSKYVKMLYCYIVAKDGEDGYINARFSFRMTKKVGKSWQNDDANWPLWERTDVLVPSVYEKLKER